MKFFDINNIFDNTLKMLEPTDANSNTLFNLLFQKIVNNFNWLLINKLGINDISQSTFLLRGKDNRSVSSTPIDYMGKGAVSLCIEFKYANIVSLSITPGSNNYILLITCIPWGDSSGGRPVQIATCTVGIYTRFASSDSDWSSWKTITTF